jgi:arylsulfatase A-like enzyme
VAERLQAAGYATGLIGEWTLGEKPWTQGFDEFAGFIRDEEGRNYFADHVWRFAPKAVINTNNVQEDWVGSEMIYENIDGKKGRYLPEVLVNAMCSFIGIHKSDPFNDYKPFFLMVNLPSPRSAKAGADEFPVPSDAPFTGERWPQAAKDRAALITRLDGSIGRLFEKFKELGISNNVAIFFSSSAAPEKFTDAKMNFLKPNGAAVASGTSPASLPMIVWWPDAVRAKTPMPFAWTSVDFAPTALDIAFAKRAKDLDGMTILPVLEGKTGPDVDSPAKRSVETLKP